jgi:hypothetical protein
VIRFYLALGLFFSFPFFWLAVAFWSWIWLAIAAAVALSGCLWFRSVAFSKILNSRHAHSFSNEALVRITRSVNETLHQKTRFHFWRISESDAQVMTWVGSNEIHLFFSQGLLARASEEQLTLMLQNILRGDLRRVRVENRLYALSLWWDELKGQPSRFRYWFISFWLYPLERILKIDKI